MFASYYVLLEAGASGEVENMDGYSASDIKWTNILGKTSKDEELIRAMFEVNGDFESMKFSLIHKIVVGIIRRDLKEELELSSAAINIPNTKGRTPLS